MPDFLKRTAPYRSSGELAVLFSTAEDNSMVEHCKQTIKDYGIDFPVLYFGDDIPVPASEWNCHGNPIGYLVNPQGVIVAHAYGGLQLPGLIDSFEYLAKLDGAYPPVGMRVELVHTDTSGAELRLDLDDSNRRDQHVEIDLEFIDCEWDEATEQFTRFERVKPDPEGPEIVLDASFQGSSQHSIPVNIPAGIYEYVLLRIKLRLPDSENELDGEGLWTHQWASVWFDDPESFEERF